MPPVNVLFFECFDLFLESRNSNQVIDSAVANGIVDLVCQNGKDSCDYPNEKNIKYSLASVKASDPYYC